MTWPLETQQPAWRPVRNIRVTGAWLAGAFTSRAGWVALRCRFGLPEGATYIGARVEPCGDITLTFEHESFTPMQYPEVLRPDFEVMSRGCVTCGADCTACSAPATVAAESAAENTCSTHNRPRLACGCCDFCDHGCICYTR